MSERGPAVSIVTATYNRSNVLAFAIRSVLAQTLTDWELIVVGDACTDDTEAVVASFLDSRIRFVNLERNCGEQSGPNNEGLRLSKGRYIAFLNHDDLWLADHLETALAGIEEMQADLVFALEEVYGPEQRSYLAGATLTGDYELALVCPASSWLFRRELYEDIGGWRSSREVFEAPSVEWLHRAFRAGKRLRLVPRLSVVAIQSGHQRNAYANRESRPQEDMARRMADMVGFRERALTDLAVRHAARDPAVRQNLRVRPYFLRALKNSFLRIGVRLGWTPDGWHHLFFYRRRGGSIDAARKVRGLPERRREGGHE